MTQDDKDESERLEQMFDGQWLDPEAMGEDEVDEALREMGVSPEELQGRGERLERRARVGALSWRSQARAKIERRRHQLDASGGAPRTTLSRGELLEALERARRASAVGEAHIATYFRSRTPEVASNEELQGLLQDLELLHRLRQEE